VPEEKPGRVVPFPAKPDGDTGTVFRIGAQVFRIDISATVTAVETAPPAEVIPIENASEKADE
jgi:hypothetical protein